jgi:asparagine synthase (glutamine-hydrolysing)
LLRGAVGNRLPESVLKHRKWGFGVPWLKYLRNLREFRDLVRELPDLEPISSGPLDRAILKNVIDKFLRGDDYHAALITQLMMIVIWRKACFNRSALEMSFQHPAYLVN